MLEKVIEYCRTQLHHSSQCSEYLKRRGITKEICDYFELGFFPSHMKSLFKAVDPKWLRAAGLVYDATKGPLQNRLIFPIYNVYDKPLAIAGRTLTAEKPKYINNSYDKRNNLYALNYAKNDIRIADVAIVVEGYFDVIKLYQYGVKNVVATCGTALCTEQVMLLARYTSNVILIYNSDDPGIKAANRAILKQQRTGIRIKSIALPQETKDVDIFLHKYGIEKFAQLIKMKGVNDLLVTNTKSLRGV